MGIIDRKITAFSKKISDRPMKERNQGTNIKLYIETPSNELKSALNGVIDDVVADYETKINVDTKLAPVAANSQNALNKVNALENQVGDFDSRISTATKKSGEALSKTTVLEGQFNQLIINEGDSNAEIVAARVKADGTEFNSLSERLNASDAAFESHLSDYATLLINVKYPPLPLESAKADGLTNVTIAIQAIIDYISGLGGGTVYLPKGTYLVSGITLPSNICLLGAGKGLSILKLINNSTHHLIYSAISSNVKISNMTLDGNKANQEINTYFGVEFNAVTNGEIENLEVKNCSAHGIDCRNSSNIHVYKCVSINNYNVGINFNSVLNGFINKNICSGNGMGGIYLENFMSKNCVVSENIVNYNGTEVSHQGILVQAENVHVTDNFTFSNHGVGIDLGNCNKITVKGNYVYDNGSIGIELNSTDNSIVSGNIVIANGRINNSSGIMVIEMGYTGGSNNNIISNNRISLGGTTYQNYAIEVSSAATNTSVIGNDVTGGGNVKNIQNAGTNTVVKDNLGCKNEGCVVAIFDTSSTGDKYLTIPHGMDVVPSVDNITFGITNVGEGLFNVYPPVCISSDGANIIIKITVVAATGISGSVGKLIVGISS